jgi:hypothetical protein
MFVVGAILTIWAVAFLAAMFPARWLGRWIVDKGANTFYGVLMCLALTKLFVACTTVFLVFARFSFFPHVNTDKRGFAIFFVAVLFFIPVFSALMFGFRRAQALQVRQA